MPPLGYKFPPGSYKKNVKRGPKKFPGSRRKRCDLRVPPVQPISRPKHSYTKKRKADVLLWLIHQRFPESRKGDFGESIAPRLKFGQPRPTPEEELERKKRKEAGDIVYRPPTYHEAEMFWKISASTITGWWGKKEKYLSPTDLENARIIRSDLMPPSTKKQPNTAAQDTSQSPSQGTATQTQPQPQPQPQPNVTQPNPVEISDDSDAGEIDSNEDEDMPDPETVMQNTGNTGAAQEFQDAVEFQQGDDGDGDDADANAYGAEETALLNLQTA